MQNSNESLHDRNGDMNRQKEDSSQQRNDDLKDDMTRQNTGRQGVDQFPDIDPPGKPEDPLQQSQKAKKVDADPERPEEHP